MLKVASDGMFRLNLCVEIDFKYDFFFKYVLGSETSFFNPHAIAVFWSKMATGNSK